MHRAIAIFQIPVQKFTFRQKSKPELFVLTFVLP